MSIAILHLRPEISTGYYQIPEVSGALDVQNADAAHSDNEPADSEVASAPSTSCFPGIPPDEAAFLFQDGSIVHNIRQRLVQAGFLVLRERMVELTIPQIRQLFAGEVMSHGDEVDQRVFVENFTRGPTLSLLLSLPDGVEADSAIETLREVVGPANPHAARRQALATSQSTEQWPLRALCGINPELYGLHASFNLDCVLRERCLLFPGLQSRMEVATIVLLPTFLRHVPLGRQLLAAQLSTNGMIVTAIADKESLTEEKLSLLCSRLHKSTSLQDREAYCRRLEQVAHEGVSTLLRIEGLDVSCKLRVILGPSSVSVAREWFPESIRAKVSEPFPSMSHIKTFENTAACLESGVFVTYDEDIVDQLLPQSHEIERTFGIIKPNAAKDPSVVESIQQTIRKYGFVIEKTRRLHLSRSQAAAFYAEHTGKVFFERLLNFMTSGEIVAMQLTRVNAILMWRGLMGPTNSLQARVTHPWTLRAQFGIDGTMNATHGSDVPESARRELRFFFGGSSSNAMPIEKPASKAVAQRGLTLPFQSSETIERVLTRGLAEMLEYEWSSPLDACQWLGQWLLLQSEAASQKNNALQPPTPVRTTSAYPPKVPGRNKSASQTAASPTHGVQPCKIVAVVVDASVSNSMRQSLVEAINSYVTPLGYVYLDATVVLQQHGGDTVSSVQSLCDEMKNSGQSRFVIIEFGSVEVLWRQHTPEVYKVHTAIEVVPEHTTLHPSSLDSSVQRVMLPLSSTLSCITEAELNSVLTSVFDPIVFLFIGNKLISSPDQLRIAANQFGFSFLTFDDIVSTEVERERDPSGPFTQAHRAHTTIPSRFLLEALRRVIIHPASVRHRSLNETAQKFLLYGFPLENVDLKTLEKSVCRVSGVIRVGADDAAPSWLMSYEKRGLVASIEGLDCVEAGIRPVIAPDVILVSGDGATSALELAARRQGLIWVNMTNKTQLHTPPNDVIATLKHILRCPGSGRNTFVLNSFPQTRQQAEQFYHSFGLPRLVIHTDKTANQELAEMTSVFPPSVLQAEVPSSEPLLLGMLNLKHIVCFVGDVQALDVDMVKRLIHGLGFSIVDLRREVLPADPSSVIVHILSAVRGTFTPRCVVIGAPGSTSVFQALEARLGSALNRIVVLKLRKPLPPPRSRNDDEEYYSDEEAEQQRQLLKEATSLSPELDQLVQYYKMTKRDKVSTLSFLKTDKLEEQLRPLVRPRLVGVLGHSHTFYRAALTTFCRRHQLPFIDLSTLLRESHTLSSKERFQRQLDALRATIAGSTASTFVVDGFPRALATDGSEAPTSAQCIGAPYIADQIRQLEISVAPIPVLVRCRASMDVLVERKPDNVTLNALADAQDLLEIATGDLVQHFETRKHRIVEISCDRDLAYACEQLDDALAAWL